MGRRARREVCDVETPGSAQNKYHADFGNTISYLLSLGYSKQDLKTLFVGAIRDTTDLNWPDVMAHAYAAQRKFGYQDHIAYIYVWRDAWGQALYVGQTTDIVKRTEQHLRKSEWTKEATSLYVRDVHKNSRLREEKETIQRLKPRYNVKHNALTTGEFDDE